MTTSAVAVKKAWRSPRTTLTKPLLSKVSTAYSIDGLKESLATISGDRGFANDFFTKYIEGREMIHYTRLLARAGLIVRRCRAGRSEEVP